MMGRDRYPVHIAPRRAISFIEVALGILILGLVVGPILATLSTLNRGTTSALYEMVAAHYASEILEQMRVLPLPTVLEAARVNSLADLVGTIDIPIRDQPVNKLVLAPGIHLLYSPLPPEVFKKRVLEVKREVRHAGGTPVNLVRVTVHVEWQPPGRPTPKRYSACTYLMEP
jgi:hypothetical protein